MTSFHGDRLQLKQDDRLQKGIYWRYPHEKICSVNSNSQVLSGHREEKYMIFEASKIAFACMAFTSLNPSIDNPEAHSAALFEYGYTQGLIDITRQGGHRRVMEDSPSPDFILGMIYGHAHGNAMKTLGNDPHKSAALGYERYKCGEVGK